MRILRLLAVARTSFGRLVPLVRDARVPMWLKVGAGVGAVLIISPLDIFGDIPFLGAIDDAVLLTVLCTWFVRLAERHTTLRVQPAGALIAK